MKLPVLFVLALGLHAQLPPACAPFGDSCLYAGPPSVRFGTTNLDLPYKDAAGYTRTLSLAVRIPATNQLLGNTPLPVVIWTQGAAGLNLWPDTTAAAGYLSVAVAHPLRDPSEKAALCTALKIPKADCEAFQDTAWDNATDLAQILTALEAQNRTGPTEIRGRIDLARVAIAGFAEGSSAALSAAGATRLLRPTASRATPDTHTLSAPVAFLALSPATPKHEGFYDTDTHDDSNSWEKITRPVLTVSADGDNTCHPLIGCIQGDPPLARTIPHELFPAPSKYLLYVNSVNLDHDFLGSLDQPACESKGVDASQCAAHSAWLRATVLAFLDAKVRKLAPAESWLANGPIAPASANAATWRSK